MNRNLNIYGFCKIKSKHCYYKPCLLLCAISYKKKPSIYLPGIEKDILNIENMCKMLNLITVKLVEDQVCLENIRECINNYNPIVVWFCGHGILNNKTKSNEYILSNGINSWPYTYNKITDLQFENLFNELNFTHSLVIPKLIVFDVCHSATFLNLQYYFYEGRFLKKINSIHPFVTVTSPLIVISAATDFSTTQEDSINGGYLTNKLVEYLLDSKGYFSLKTLDSLRPSSTDKTHNLIISINKKENIYTTHTIVT